MDLNDDTKQVNVFLNSNITVTCEATVSSRMTIADIISECKEKWNLESYSKCILFDSNGAELSDDDIEYMNNEEPLFLSLGEKFSTDSSLAVYKEIKKLGEGGFGAVYLYEHKFNHQQVAIKSIKFKSLMSPKDINRVYDEIATLRELRHPNIVLLHQYFLLNKEICLVMEYCSGGEVGKYLQKHGPLPEEKAYSLALQIVDAIRYCHNSKIIHRDLKLENILFSSDTYAMIKVVDFGISGIFSFGNSGDRSDAGSILYIPPEIYKNVDNRANPAIDIWALGCIFYYLLMGKHPFKHSNIKDIINHIENVNYEPLSDNISKPWHKLIKGILRYNPHKRWDIIRIQEHLEKYRDNSEEVSSDNSEEIKEAINKNKSDIITRNPSNLLKVPDLHIKIKSLSPSRQIGETHNQKMRASPRNQIHNKKL